MSLIEAVKAGDIEKVNELVNEETVNQKDKYGCSALYYAAENGNIDSVDILIAHNTTIDERNILEETPLMRSVIKGHNEVVQKLLKARANPNLADKDGYNSVHRAAFRNDLNLVKLLLEYNGDLGAKTNNNDTIMHCAAVGVTENRLDWELVRWLLSQGIAPDAANNDNFSVKDILAQKDISFVSSYEEIVSSLVGNIAEGGQL